MSYSGKNEAGSNTNISHQSGLLILRPRLHDCTIIHTIYDNVGDSQLSQGVLILEIIGNLLCGSGRSKCSRKTHQNNFLVLAEIREVVFFGRKVEMQVHTWELVPNRGKASNGSPATSRRSNDSRIQKHPITMTGCGEEQHGKGCVARSVRV